MIETIAEFYDHRVSVTGSGIVVGGDGIHLVFNDDGEITYCIFEGTEVNQIIDYAKWVELVKTEGAGTPLANHAAFHVSKRTLA
ncbi:MULTISPECIES: hypothetical protein [Pseudomonas syringae group]|uniref:hypothetical protein n=1 Tax=Pseudomonas syringae group TaxID=136849 RepID=UPI000F78F0A0|nr:MULTISPECIES: hypothetical protein [Pseudomonas syringae group]MCK9715233.1 hypothetical protein [Pseudomonas syringae pv. syringae]MCK9761315.1 hypothetical protein [Pseudomonas syringae pv. syringae]